MTLVLTGRSPAKQEQREKTITKQLKRARRLVPGIQKILLDADKAEEKKITLGKTSANQEGKSSHWLEESKLAYALSRRDSLEWDDTGHLLRRLTKGITPDELRKHEWSEEEIDTVKRLRQLCGLNPRTGRLPVSLTGLIGLGSIKLTSRQCGN